MPTPSIDVFTDRSVADAARLEASAEVGRLLAQEWPLGPAWSAACRVLHDEDETVALRCAAARLLANAPGAAPNQLVRGFHDPERAVRKQAIAVLRSIAVPPRSEQRLAEELAAAEGAAPVLALLNLALTFGHDSRIVDVYHRSLASANPEVRGAAVRGLAMLGDLEPAIAAVDDDAASVRQEAASSIAGWSTLAPAEIEAVQALVLDVDQAVAKAARKALRILGVRPVARPPRRVWPEPAVAPGWPTLLAEISLRWLGDREHAAGLDDDVIRSGWLGRPAAERAHVDALVRRIGRPLPPSYASFLAVSDGFGRVCAAIDELLAAASVRPFADEHADWIAAYAEHDPDLGRELGAAWQVSTVHDGVLLLHPDYVGDDGEWQASLFADWVPGIERHPSFLALIRALAS